MWLVRLGCSALNRRLIAWQSVASIFESARRWRGGCGSCMDGLGWCSSAASFRVSAMQSRKTGSERWERNCVLKGRPCDEAESLLALADIGPSRRKTYKGSSKEGRRQEVPIRIDRRREDIKFVGRRAFWDPQ